MLDKKAWSARLTALRAQLRSHQVDGFILTNNLDQFYLTNFFFYSEESVFLIYAKGVICFTRDLYVEPFGAYAPQIKVIGGENRVKAAVAYAKKLGLKRVGFDSAKEPYFSGSFMHKNGLVELPSIISEMREQKTADELKLMRASNRIAYLAYEHVRSRIKTGMTECEVAALLEKFMREHGATTTSFLSIVCFGENAANPHHETGNRKLKKEDAILMDFGCIYKGYCSDITRSWWHGNHPPAEYTKIWNLVEKARRAGVKKVRIGAATKDVDAAARGVIESAGYGVYFTHRTGHGVGLEVHENPCNSADSAAILKEGNVVTVEPGIYLPGKFGVRLEDTMAVSKKGANILTKK